MEKTVKIVSAPSNDAEAPTDNVRVILPDGAAIPSVFKVEWCAEVYKGKPYAKIYAWCNEVDIETGAEVVSVCPMCKKEIEEKSYRMPIITETGEKT